MGVRLPRPVRLQVQRHDDNGPLSGGDPRQQAVTVGPCIGPHLYRVGGQLDAWQASQQGAAVQPQTVGRVPPAEVEQHSQAVLRALVAAAKSDGHVDDRERALIEGEFTRLDNDGQLQQWLHAELNKPLDPAEVASAAQTPEIAAEMYLASLMMVDQENFMERAYLDELARRLGLQPGLREELEKQARQAAAQA